MVYLDNAATTRVCPEAAEAAVHMMTECFGNPSTTYKLGREAKAAVDRARGQIAGALGCRPDEVYFTSCGSEGDNWALISGARSMHRRGKHIISSAVEHDAVRKSLDFLEKRDTRSRACSRTAQERSRLSVCARRCGRTRSSSRS